MPLETGAPGQPDGTAPASMPEHGRADKTSAMEKALSVLKTTDELKEEDEESKGESEKTTAEADDAEKEAPKPDEKKEPAKADDEKPEEEKKPPEKTAEERKAERDKRLREANEYASARKFKKKLAEQEREIKRKQEDLTKQQADFSKAQQEFSELNKLMKDDPDAFVRRLSGGYGGLRPLLERVLGSKDGADKKATGGIDETVVNTFKEELAKRDEALQALQDRLDKQEEERKKLTEQETEQQQLSRVRAGVRQQVAQVSKDDYPLVFKHDVDDVADHVYNTWLKRYQEDGEDIDLVTALDQMESTLQATVERLVGPGWSAPKAPPAQDTGAVDESRQTPGAGQISNGSVTARASGSRPESRDERKARAARLLSVRK